MRCQNAKIISPQALLQRVVPPIVLSLLLINTSVHGFPSTASAAALLTQRQQQQRYNSLFYKQTRQLSPLHHSLLPVAIVMQQDDDDGDETTADTAGDNPLLAMLPHDAWDSADWAGMAREDEEEDGVDDAGEAEEQPWQRKRKLLTAQKRKSLSEEADGDDGDTSPREMARSHAELFTRMRSICGRMNRLKRKRTPRPGSPESLVAFLCDSAKFG